MVAIATDVETALSASGVSVRFGGVRALTDVSISVRPGTVCGLIGPNGAGKTTFLDALSGHNTPSAGTVILKGQDVTGRSVTWRSRHGLRRTFQRQQLFGWLSVEDNLLVPLEWRGAQAGLAADLVRLPMRQRLENRRRETVDRVLATVGIEHLAKATAGTLPIGQARMVEFARAIVEPPVVLLLDEPTSGLGASETDKLGDAVRRLCETSGTAVVLVEHDVAFVMRTSDRILALHLGRVLAEGTAEEVHRDPAVRDAYLGD